MPTYEYACRACGHEFEEFQSIKAEPIAVCPKCRKRKVERLIGTGGAVIFKGGGFYETDYRSESYREGAKRETSGSEGAGETAGDASKASKASKPSQEPRAAEAKPKDAREAATPAGESGGGKTTATEKPATSAERGTKDRDTGTRADDRRIEARATHPSRIGRGIGNIVGNSGAAKGDGKPAAHGAPKPAAKSPAKPAAKTPAKPRAAGRRK
jgi:putative FmdB family regulatory protein